METALILPILVLLLFSAVDLLRFIELSDRVNQAADVITKHASHQEFHKDDDFSTSLLLAEEIVVVNKYASVLSLQIIALSVQPSSGKKILWRRAISTGAVKCISIAPEFTNLLEEKTDSRKVGFFIVTTLCAKPDNAFFLTWFFDAEALIARSQGVAFATSPTIRNLD